MITDWKKPFAIEIKSKSDTEKKLAANVRQYAEMRKDEIKAQVFYLGALNCEINGVKYVPWQDWGAD